jgi:hypothetical protein
VPEPCPPEETIAEVLDNAVGGDVTTAVAGEAAAMLTRALDALDAVTPHERALRRDLGEAAGLLEQRGHA